MATIRTACLTLGVLLGSTGAAFALKPGMHADITSASCRASGLGKSMCTRIATENYDTDSREWDDLRAHAQIDDGQTACEAADATADRMWNLGNELRTALARAAASPSNTTAGAVDALIGRAAHTIQDNCAHDGMPNPQHAWLSLGDFCEGTATSPDVQDDAIACAKVETDALMKIVARSVSQARLGPALDSRSCPPAPSSGGDHDNTTSPAVCNGRFLPGPFDACDFLSRAKDWDGIDRRWNGARVTPALRAAFAAGLAGERAIAPICGGNERVLSPGVSDPIVDVRGGAPRCGKASLFCLGKADDSENPFADDEALPEDGGCNTGGGSTGGLAVALALLVARRRRRS
ncbi:hypothetical protein BH11MYX3_BH11MYX3_27960 [soil metagenome]